MSWKNLPRRITVSEMAPHIHSFNPGENKVNKLANWLMDWIDAALKSGKIRPYDFLPTKGELACHIGVSLGTMQNVFRQVEDAGYLQSKQRVGTFIKDRKSESSIEKLTSKRELAVEIIKKYITENSLKSGDILTSTRKLAELTGLSAATVRTAAGKLVQDGILGKKDNTFIVLNPRVVVGFVEMQTLVEKSADRLEYYIKRNLKPGDKLPANTELAQMFNISVKTIHDAIKLLSKKGILYPRRGRYGTVVLNGAEEQVEEPYFYEKVAHKVRNYISKECKVGDKLPPITEFSERFDVSPKTVKKALDSLAEDGYLTFMRGRYGGTFVTDIPQDSKDAYTWLALNSEYFDNLEQL